MDPAINLAAMDIEERMAALRADGRQRAEAAGSLAALADVEAETVGRRSPVAEARRALGGLDPDERRRLGQLINEVAGELEALIASRRAVLEAADAELRLEAELTDVTLPGRVPARGSHHLVQQVIDEIVDIFVAIGYTVATGPEAETEYYNFTALNIPEGHPARLGMDTFYLDYGDVPEEILLRAHTSPMQIRFMEEHDPPVYVVVPGRVFRRDTPDQTHTPVFHQIEGLAVDEGITMADLKGTLAHFAREFFGPGTEVKFVPSYFPFTEPSAEMLAYANGRWIELLGCGMVNPTVYDFVGYDPDRVTGFAFGFGVDRMAMVRHGMEDLRTIFDPDVRVLEQYR